MNIKLIIKTVFLVLLFLSGCDQKNNNKQIIKENIEPKKQVQTSHSKLKKIKSQTNKNRFKVNMFFISQKNCGACEQVREYMEDENTKEYLSKDFIVSEIDITQKEKLPYSWMEPVATPTLYFLDPKGQEIVDTVVKRLGELEFTEIIEEVIEIRDME